MRLRHYLDEGYTQTGITELLGMSRRTIYRWIKSGTLDRAWRSRRGTETKSLAAALIDRLLHHCHIVNIRGNSYPMRQHSELWQALHGDAEPEPRPHHRKKKEIKPPEGARHPRRTWDIFIRHKWDIFIRR